MALDPKAQEAMKKMEEMVKKIAAKKFSAGQFDAVMKEGKSLKGDKEIPD